MEDMQIDSVTKRPDILPVEVIKPCSVFNLPLYEDYFVIDLRDAKSYESGHIASAISLPVPKERSIQLNDLHSFFKAVVNIGSFPERFSPLVLYGDASQKALSDAKQLVHWLSDIGRGTLEISTANGSEKYFLDRLRSLNKVWIIEGGYSAFQQQFGILCGIPDPISLPVCFAPYLFLGSRCTTDPNRRHNQQLCLGHDTLKSLGITHVVVHDGMSLTVKDTDSIECLKLPVEDNEEANMRQAWDTAIQFIEEVGRLGKRILVQVHGRSTSASFIVAWAMRIKQMNYQEALQFVTDTCFYRLDKSLMHLQQLRQYEHVDKAIEY